MGREGWKVEGGVRRGGGAGRAGREIGERKGQGVFRQIKLYDYTPGRQTDGRTDVQTVRRRD